MAAIRLQFVTDKGLSSALIRWFSHGPFSHVDAVMPDGRLLGARLDGGVRVRPPGYAAFTLIDRVTLPCAPEIADAFHTWLRRQVGLPYDWTAIVAFGAGRDWRDPGKWFCSELVARGLEISGYFPSPLEAPCSRITPVDLRLAVSARPAAPPGGGLIHAPLSSMLRRPKGDASMAASEAKTLFVVQTYVKGPRGALRVGEQIPCPTESAARARAERMMAAGRVLGVDVVRQSADPEAGEYGEPQYLLRLGQVPEVG